MRELIKSGKVDAMEARLASGANPDEFSGGEPLIFWAWKTNQIEALRLLVRSGAHLDQRDRWGRTLLMLVAMECDVNVVRYLMDSGADINALTPEGDNALNYSLYGLHESPRCLGGQIYVTLKLLLDAGSNPNRKNRLGITPLSQAVFFRRLDIAKLLVRYGADPNQPSVAGKSPITLAEESGYTEIARFLAW